MHDHREADVAAAVQDHLRFGLVHERVSRRDADGLVVAFANHFVVLDHPLEGGQGQKVHDDWLIALTSDIQAQLSLDQADGQLVGSVFAPGNGKVVDLDQVIDRNGALMLLIGRATAQRRLVERDQNKPVVAFGLTHAVVAPRPRRLAPHLRD